MSEIFRQSADKLLNLPFDSMKRALESDKHVKSMSFAEELALMPAFSKDTAVCTFFARSCVHSASCLAISFSTLSLKMTFC
jgi:hypothetical protein